MRKTLVMVLLLSTLMSSSGCVLGMAALVRWDQKRWKAMQEKERAEREASEESAGSCSEVDGVEGVQQVPESESGAEEEDSVPVSSSKD